MGDLSDEGELKGFSEKLFVGKVNQTYSISFHFSANSAEEKNLIKNSQNAFCHGGLRCNLPLGKVKLLTMNPLYNFDGYRQCGFALLIEVLLIRLYFYFSHGIR